MACHKPKGAVGALRAPKRLVAVLVGLAAAIAGAGAPLGPAFAGQLQTARARAAALAVMVDNEAHVVHDLTLRYQDDAAQAAYWHEQALRAEAAARSLEVSSASTEALLEEEAVLSYADSVPSVKLAAGESGDFVEAADQEAYTTAAVGDLSATLAQFNNERSGLAGTIATAKNDLRRDLASESGAAAARRAALGEAASLQAMLARTRSEIAALSARQGPPTGPPVGNGIVRALAAQLETSSPDAATVVATTASEPAPVTTTTRATTTTQATTTTVATRATTTTQATTTTVATVTTTDPAAPSASVATTAVPSSPAGGVWLELRECESGDNYQADTGNGYYGAYQFSPSTWSDLGYPGQPNEEPYWMQDAAAQRLEAAEGWSQWPSCSAALGL